MKWVLGLLVVLFLFLQFQLWLGEGGLIEVKRLREAINTQQQENARLKARNAALEAEVRDLKRGLEAVEERARSELGMIKKDETFFQIIEEE